METCSHCGWPCDALEADWIADGDPYRREPGAYHPQCRRFLESINTWRE